MVGSRGWVNRFSPSSRLLDGQGANHLTHRIISCVNLIVRHATAKMHPGSRNIYFETTRSHSTSHKSISWPSEHISTRYGACPFFVLRSTRVPGHFRVVDNCWMVALSQGIYRLRASWRFMAVSEFFISKKCIQSICDATWQSCQAALHESTDGSPTLFA
jgi:hypothetical protein